MTTIYITGCQRSEGWIPKPETVERFTALFQAAINDLEPPQPVKIVHKCSSFKEAQYAFVVNDRSLGGLGAGRFFGAGDRSADTYAEKVYGVHIITKARGLDFGKGARIDEPPAIHSGSFSEGNFCFYLPEEGQQAPNRPPFDCAVWLSEDDNDPLIRAVAEKLISAEFARKLLNPPRVEGGTPPQPISEASQEPKNWKTMGIVLGVLAGVAALITVLAALVFFGVPIIAAAVAGTFIAAAAGKMAIGALIATAMLGLGCLIACRS